MEESKDYQSCHSFSKGRPTGHLFQTVSTQAIAPRQRYEYWSDHIIRSAITSAPDTRLKNDFKASVTSLATMSGEMHYAKADAYNVHLTDSTIRQSPCDELSLFLMLKGQVIHTYENGTTLHSGAGDFFLLDGRHPVSLHFTAHEIIQVDLSRPLLESALTGKVPAPAAITAALNRSTLARLLRDHLCQFPVLSTSMAPMEQLALLDATESFAITTIGGVFSSGTDTSPCKHAGLFAAARHYIRKHLANTGLTTACIAAAIGCSPALLDQLFAHNELTVQGYIREMRLQQFLRLLQKEPHQPIHVLALRCGLHDETNINRSFRKRFGVNPSDVRRCPTANDRRPENQV